MKSDKDLKEKKTALLNLRDNLITNLGRIDAQSNRLVALRKSESDKLTFVSGKLALIDELLTDETEGSDSTEEVKENNITEDGTPISES